jgi:hypothetical protein
MTSLSRPEDGCGGFSEVGGFFGAIAFRGIARCFAGAAAGSAPPAGLSPSLLVDPVE